MRHATAAQELCSLGWECPLAVQPPARIASSDLLEEFGFGLQAYESSMG